MLSIPLKPSGEFLTQCCSVCGGLTTCSRELADLLGQVKPQTVTKDEIDKSGLEIISPATLEQYERDGKVASNCLDRVSRLARILSCLANVIFLQCLICLDDYVPEDNLRLLSCRHAFHKTCVDQWLTLGKNNCPACRTTVCRKFIHSYSALDSPL